ncbi:uncharacterized protein LOC143285119 [Babylonia areolata]|uniref:uncharacterized protein LOC143285119 n=1 Tax=Babylonia areolata TaxID=304850 RepID=UPI003FD46B1B
MSEQDLFRLWGLSLSSPSASDLSEGVSDMSLSTSPGSDCPQHSRAATSLTNGKTTNGENEVIGSSSRLRNGESGDEGGPKPRRRLVVRQLSSNPYLASSSSMEDHNPLTPAASFAFGENNDPEEAPVTLRSCSYPAGGEFVENLAHQQQYSQIHHLSQHNQPLNHDQYYSNVVNGNIQEYTFPSTQSRTVCNNTRTTPPEAVSQEVSSVPRSVNSWGHFSKSSYNRYKYRRSDYSSDSDEDVRHPSPSQLPHKVSSMSGGSVPHPHTCLSEFQHISSNSNRKKSATDTKKDHNHFTEGVRPNVFKERFATMKRWFSECSHEQKNIVLKGLLSVCDLPQLHLLSVRMETNLHRGCPPNCQDFLTWLPTPLAAKIMTYLDPVSLCRAAQVCKLWQQLAEEPSLWRRFCCRAKWRLSKAAEHKQVISYMSSEGSIQWKRVFAERFRLRNNWLAGRCTVRTFEGHTQGISCVQFDDNRIVSGSSDKTIKVWNIRTNAKWSVQTLVGHSGTVRCLHLEGNRLVSGSSDRTIKVWDLSTQDSWSSIACKVTMIGHRDTVRCLQVDDDKVISGSYDMTLKVWDLRSGHCRKTLAGHQAAVLCVHFNDTKIVSGSADKTIKLWNYEGQCMRTLTGHQDAVTCLQFDSTRIVSGSLDCNLKFWDIVTGDCINTIDWKAAEGHTGVVRFLQADSWRVVSAADDKTLKVWSLETGERLVTLRNHSDGVTCLQFNDFIIVSGSYDKTVKLWDFSCC